MIFVDTHLFVYAVGRDHPLKEPARAFFQKAAQRARDLGGGAPGAPAHLPSGGRLATLDAALELVRGAIGEVWELVAEDVSLARSFADR